MTDRCAGNREGWGSREGLRDNEAAEGARRSGFARTKRTQITDERMRAGDIHAIYLALVASLNARRVTKV